jgi:hypothetical protein
MESRTQKFYLNRISCFILFHLKRRSQDMTEEKASEFLTHLATKIWGSKQYSLILENITIDPIRALCNDTTS